MLKILFYIVFLALCISLIAEELYKYTDENGVEHIVDSPYKLPADIRDRYIKEYEKTKKTPLPPDLQDTRPAYKDVVNEGYKEEVVNQDKENKKDLNEKKRKIEELSKEMEEKVKELGYKRQRALITQIPALKEEVRILNERIEEIKKEIERLNGEETINPKERSTE